MKRITVCLLIMIMVLTNAGAAFAGINETVLPIKAELFTAEEPEISFTVSEKITATNDDADDPTKLSYSDLLIENNASPLQLDSISAVGKNTFTLVADADIDTAAADSFSMTAAICDDSQDLGEAADNTFTTNRRISRDATLTVNFSGRYVLPDADKKMEGAALTLTFSKFEADYLIFESDERFEIQFMYDDMGLYWSYDGADSENYTESESWNSFSYDDFYVYATRKDSQSPYMLCLKGGAETFVDNFIRLNSDDYNIIVSGSMEGLDNCSGGLFIGCKALKDARDLVFPNTITVNSAYENVFAYCTSLEYAPKLPATTLADACYDNMFRGCTSLKEAPELPATTLADSCYECMFRYCTSLKEAPELPATTLADGCYRMMFQGCTSLKEAPELPATTLATSCYWMMFQGCTSLKEAPELPATTLTKNCYCWMFTGCTSLETIPKLPAAQLKYQCYEYMFKGCTSLKLSQTQDSEYKNAYRIPASGTGVMADYAIKDMFADTGGSFTGTPDINTTYYTANTIVG